MKTEEKNYPVIHQDQHDLFVFVERVKDEFVICVGNNVICEKVFKTLEEAKAHVFGTDWQILTNVMCLISEKVFDQKTLIQKMQKLNKPKKTTKT